MLAARSSFPPIRPSRQLSSMKRRMLAVVFFGADQGQNFVKSKPAEVTP